MNTTNEIKNKVKDLYAQWVSQVEIRNNSEYGSARYNRADTKSDNIENEMSMLVFGDITRTATEAYDTVTE
jgi:hypothetical protein